ncbi:uncharacterized protein EAE97_000099 [Botrytis byssoidea]|uniref:AAA+ ATPase domain-containing protein n=1 Tax=Botrytis byssoidea TaxID=139641 RepID=A0A9P5M8K8_9HELO|nr:uncharacterized protein EAE97_000099 [Botrytis byssoidea]KAF7954840.1 hypothetical protein EAE97_000099 [Botrytis byssoidea]
MAPSTNSAKADDQTEPPSIGIKRVETAQDSKAQRLLRVDQIYSRYVLRSPFTRRPIPMQPQKGPADTLRMLAETEVDIKSVLLKEVLLEIFDGVEGLSLNKTPPMCSPEILFHAKDALTSRKADEKEKDDPNQTLINDIESLLNNGEITFDLLWALMKPKDYVVSIQFRLTGQSQALSVVSGTYHKRQNSTNYFKLNGRMISHDGEDFGYDFVDTEIDEFDGARKITSLKAYPIQYDPNSDTLRKNLIQRGRKYLSLIRALPQAFCQEYTMDFGLEDHETSNGRIQAQKANLRGRVMADPEAWKFNNGWTDLATPIILGEYSITGKDLDLHDDQLLVCANWINGFSLTHKSWTTLLLMKSLKTKGKVVGLLSGSPGVGKTLTAEAVAEVTSRPLYQVSTGELGIDADKVDKRLGMILEITTRWGCVLLIDEAEIFLATRGNDLARDTLVSIFLRRLEYFRGVLILTTNRKSEIDPAQCRIHFSIHYPDLTESGRVTVWTNFIDTISKQTGTPSLDSADIEKLARLELNGRQIKNAVSCAVSLAREEKEPLSVNHIEMILSITNL